MDNLLKISKQNQKRAWDIIRETQIIEAWESFGAQVNLVGSLKTGLLMNNLDIDFHIYSDNFSITDSFAAIAQIAQNPRIKRVEYRNQLETEELCVEWHAWYLDNDDKLWQIDMIHILKESPYAGWFEKVADRINAVFLPEYKHAILAIKNDIPPGEKVMGIEIYQAVIQQGIRNYTDFEQWKKTQPEKGIIDWMP